MSEEEKEVEDALIVLYKCSLKDKEYTTQKEQYKIVREYILQQQKEIEESKEKYFEKQIIQGRIDLLKELLEE